MSTQDIFDDFRGLDPNDPGDWPLAPRIASLIAVFAITAGIAWWLSGSSQVDALRNAEKKEQQLKNEWKQKKANIVSLEVDEEEVKRISNQFDALLRQLPNSSELDVLLSDITQAGVGRGLQIEFVRPAAEIVKDFYAEMPINISLTGDYHAIGEFAGDIARLPRIIALDKISLKSGGGGGIKFDATAVTYRYVSGEAQQQQTGGRRNR